MGILSRPRFVPQQRLDLEDVNVLLSAVRTDAKYYTKQFLSISNLIYKGFSVTGIGLNSATIVMPDSTLIIPQNSYDFSWFVAAASEPNITIPDADLVDNSRNYVELQLVTENNTPLTRALWDPEANSGSGAEFSQIIETITDLKVEAVVSTGGFSGSPDRVPLCIIDVDNSGVIKTIFDRRPLFGRLGVPSNIDNRFSWGTKVEPTYALTMSGTLGTFIAGETITIGGETATVVTGGTSSISFNAPTGINFFPGDSVSGGTSGASGTINTISESFTGVDKNLKTQKDINDALMTELAIVKGTRFWYQDPQSSLAGIAKFLESILVQATATGAFSWDGSNLKITDNNGSPGNDILGYIRILGRSGDLALTREDGTGGTSPIAMSDRDILFVKIPSSGSRTFSDTGSGDTNFQLINITSYESSDTNYWIAYREGTRCYIRGYGELEPGETVNIGDPELENVLAQMAANLHSADQDRTMKLIEGGTWSLDNAGIQLTLDADAYIQIPELDNNRNTISAQNINLPDANSIAYVTINRSGSGASVRAVTVADANSVTLGHDDVIIARKVSDGVLVGRSFLLKPNEYLELDGALAEINRRLGQLKVKKHENTSYKARIDGADILQLNGDTLSQVVGNFLMKFTGAVINFSTGVILEDDDLTALGTNFTPFSIPSGEYFWYGISLVPGNLDLDNTQFVTVQVDPADSSNAIQTNAPKPLISGDIKLGAVLIHNNSGTLEIADIKRLGVGSGSGSGSKVIKADYLDPVSTALPTGSSVTIDGISGVNGDLVLFTNLSLNNNRVYKLSGVGSSIAWTAQRVFSGQLDPEDGDSVQILSGDAFQDQRATFNGTNFLVNDVVRFFDGVSGNFWELGSIKNTAIANNTTDTVFSVNYLGSENMTIEYSIIRGSAKETGQLLITTDGSTVAVAKASTNIGDAGVEFSAAISVGVMTLSYTSNNSGSSGTLKYFVKRWSDAVTGGPTGIPSYSGGGGGGGSAGGSNGDIQFNNSGVLDGDSRLQWDGSLGAVDLNGLKIGALNAGVTLNDNQVSPTMCIQYDKSYNFAIIEYSVVRDTSYRVGRLLIPNTGAAVSLSDDFVETSSTGITFSATVSGSNINVTYTSTSTGFTGTLKFSIRRWS